MDPEALYAAAIVVVAFVFLVGIFIGMGLSDREWMACGDLLHGTVIRGGREFMVVDVDDQHACNAAREFIEDLQDQQQRGLG